MSCIITLKNPALMRFPHLLFYLLFNFWTKYVADYEFKQKVPISIYRLTWTVKSEIFIYRSQDFVCEFSNFCTDKYIIQIFLLFLGHLSHSGDLLLWVGVRRRAVCVIRRPLTSSSQELLGQS